MAIGVAERLQWVRMLMWWNTWKRRARHTTESSVAEEAAAAKAEEAAAGMSTGAVQCRRAVLDADRRPPYCTLVVPDP